MGDISVIARRLSSGAVQYGWSGNGGYFSNTGLRLLRWYNDGDADKIDYLFGLGELSLIGAPGSEKGGMHWYETHMTTGEPHSIGSTEREIFSKIMFVDYGYFYDSDGKWYYVKPGPFRVKIPLETVWRFVDANGVEYKFLHRVELAIMEYVFTVFAEEDSDFANLIKEQGLDSDSLYDELCKLDEDECNHPVYDFYKRYPKLFNYFDDWVVFDVDENGTPIFKMQKDSGEHEETINW